MHPIGQPLIAPARGLLVPAVTVLALGFLALILVADLAPGAEPPFLAVLAAVTRRPGLTSAVPPLAFPAMLVWEQLATFRSQAIGPRACSRAGLAWWFVPDRPSRRAQ
jgi:hypothetical protein